MNQIVECQTIKRDHSSRRYAEWPSAARPTDFIQAILFALDRRHANDHRHHPLIHPNADARAAFFKFWKESLEIPERENLVGEYLSEPLTADQAGFPCSLFNAPASAKYVSFFNVGMWKSKEDFEAKVIKPFVGNTPKTQPFEFEFRERMILQPFSIRAGKYPVPMNDAFA